VRKNPYTVMMTLTLNLPEKLEQRLRLAAQQQHLSEVELVEQLLAEKLEPSLALLESWLEQGIDAEQQQTWETIRQGLEANRDGVRQLFPPEQQGKSW
jgi:hypothetical protein